MRFLKYMVSAPLLVASIATLYPLIVVSVGESTHFRREWIAEDMLQAIVGLFLLLLSIAFFFIIHKNMDGVVSRKTMERLMEKGKHTQANVIQLWDTGMTINDDPVVRVMLKIEGGDGFPYQVEIKQMVSRLSAHHLSVGMLVGVWVDPNNPEIVVLDI